MEKKFSVLHCAVSNCGTAADGSAPEIPNYVILQNAQQFLKAATIPATSNTAKPRRWSASFDSFQTEARGIVCNTNRTVGAVSTTGTGLIGLQLVCQQNNTHLHPIFSSPILGLQKYCPPKYSPIKILFALLVSPIHKTGRKGGILKVDSWAWT
jgi:hypothetical protein